MHSIVLCRTRDEKTQKAKSGVRGVSKRVRDCSLGFGKCGVPSTEVESTIAWSSGQQATWGGLGGERGEHGQSMTANRRATDRDESLIAHTNGPALMRVIVSPPPASDRGPQAGLKPAYLCPEEREDARAARRTPFCRRKFHGPRSRSTVHVHGPWSLRAYLAELDRRWKPVGLAGV